MVYAVVLIPPRGWLRSWRVVRGTKSFADAPAALQPFIDRIGTAGVYELGAEPLPAYVPDIRHLVRPAPQRIFALVTTDAHGERIVRYVGVESQP